VAELKPPRPLSDDDPIEEFDCGRDSMNAWFRQHARRNHEAGNSRVTVLTETGTGTIIGYLSLSAGHIEREYLPKSARGNRPENIPVILLGQLAVDRRFHGRSFARQLLLYVLKTCVALSKDIGCFAVLTHPLDDDVRAFYRRLGFEDLPGDPRRSMAVRINDLLHDGLQ
jgi:GNAT superfamily N-acetyltransferase